MPLGQQERDVLKYVGQHLVYGLTAGLTFGLAVLYTNLGNLRTLALESHSPALVLVVFFFGLFVTFGSVGMGVGIMTMGLDDNDGD